MTEDSLEPLEMDMAGTRIRAPKIKVHWRGSEEGVKHAVREVDGVNKEKAVCGAAVKAGWTPPGTRAKKADVRCGKCVRWEPLGMGPGGPNYKAAKTKEKSAELAEASV